MPPSRPRVQTVHPRKSKRPRTQHASASAPTRLKKPRATAPPPPPVAATPAPTASSAAAAAAAAKIAALEPRINLFLNAAVRAGPPTALLCSIADLVSTVPVPHLLAKLPKLPRVLLVAARLGVRDDPLGDGIVALARALTIFAKGAAVTVPQDERERRATRSAFHARENDGFSRIELEALRRGGNWALALITNCVRGDGEGHERDAREAIAHHDTMRAFVAPRDSLDGVMCTYYQRSINERIDTIVKHRGMSAGKKVALLQAICRKLCCVGNNHAFVKVVERVLLAAITIDHPLRRGEGDIATVLGSDEFVDLVMRNGEHSFFLQICSPAQHCMLSLSHKAWLIHKESVVRAFRLNNDMGLSDEEDAVSLLADVAAERVEFHWELMDDIRKSISSDDEPFAIRHWKDRAFYRAVLAVTVDKLCFMSEPQTKTMTSTTKPAMTPLFRRFPLRYQQMIRGITAAAWASVQRRRDLGGDMWPSCMAIDTIFNVLYLESGRSVPPSAHALLLCIESLLETILWDIGYRSHEAGEVCKNFRMEHTIKAVSTVIAVAEEIRLPGGNCAEGVDVLSRRVRAIEHLLKGICYRNSLPSVRTNEWGFSGLMAMFICGALCSRKLDGLEGFYSSLDCVEKVEIHRAAKFSLRVPEAPSFPEGRKKPSKVLQKLMNGFP